MPAVLLGLIVFLLFSFALRRRSSRPIDFYQFWVIRNIMDNRTVNNLYSPLERKSIKEELDKNAPNLSSEMLRGITLESEITTSPTPLLYTVFYFFNTGDFEQDYQRFALFSGLIFMACVFLLGLSLRVPSLLLLALVYVFTEAFWAFNLDVQYGNLTGLQVAGVSLSMMLLQLRGAFPKFFVGLFLSLLILLKPNIYLTIPMLFIFWAANRDYLKLLWCSVGMGMAFLIGILAPFKLFSFRLSWQHWWVECPKIVYQDFFLQGGCLGANFGLKSVLASTLFQLLMFVLISSWILWTVTHSREKISLHYPWLDEASVLCLGVLLNIATGAMCHSQYFMLIIPAVLLFFRGRPRVRGVKIHGAMVGALVLIIGHPLFIKWGLHTQINHSWLTFLGVWSMIVIQLMDFRNRRRIFLGI